MKKETFFSNALVICLAVTSIILADGSDLFAAIALFATLMVFFRYLCTQTTFYRASFCTSVVSFVLAGLLYLLQDTVLPPDTQEYTQDVLITCGVFAFFLFVISWVYRGRGVVSGFLVAFTVDVLISLGGFIGIPLLENFKTEFMVVALVSMAGAIVFWSLHFLPIKVINKIPVEVKGGKVRETAFNIFRVSAVFYTLLAVLTFLNEGYVQYTSYEGKTVLLQWFTWIAIVSWVLAVAVRIRLSRAGILWMGAILTAIFGLQLLALYGLNCLKPMDMEVYQALFGIMIRCFIISAIILIIGFWGRRRPSLGLHWILHYFLAVCTVVLLVYWTVGRYWCGESNNDKPIYVAICLSLTSIISWILARRLDKK